MESIAVIIIVFSTLILLFDQFRGLFSHFILNRTISKALDKAPETVPLLIAKLEERRPWPVSPIGWVALVFGLIIAAAAVVSGENLSVEIVALCAGPILVGTTIIFAHRRNIAQTFDEIPKPSDIGASTAND